MAALRNSALAGRYRLTSRIATGGMGEVWRAEDTLLHRKVAVKVLRSELTSDQTFVERFRAEARNTAALSHPGIAAVHDYGEITDGDSRTAYLVMELVDGEPLSAVLLRTGRLPVPRVLNIVGQAAAALDAAHRAGMVHRDVKPGNLLVGPDDTVKITDFGIARVADTVPLTQAGMVVGTAQYFAPEQAEGKHTTPASDVYSLGVVAYECLAGRLPFVADSSVAVAVMQIRDQAPPLPDDVPPPVRGLVGRAMAKDPRQRFATGGEFAAAIQAVRDSQLLDDRTTAVRGRPPPTTRVLPSWHPSPGYPPGVPTGPAGGPGGSPVPAAPLPAGMPAGGPPGPIPPGAGPGQHTGVSLGQHRTGPVAGPVPPGPSGRRRFWLAVLGSFAVLLVVLGVVLVTHDSASPQKPQITDTPSVSTDSNGVGGGAGGGAPTGMTTVTVDASEFAGRQVEDVVGELSRLGLVPTVRFAGHSGKPGEVITVTPEGIVPVGTKVVIVAVDQRPGGRAKRQDD